MLDKTLAKTDHAAAGIPDQVTPSRERRIATRRLRIALFAPHFAEYATRLATALAEEASVVLFLDKYNCAEECDPALLQEARRKLWIVEFDSRGRAPRNRSRVRVLSWIWAFRPHVVHVQEQPDTLTTSIVRVIGPRRKMVLTVHDPEPHSGNDHAYATRMAPQRRLLRDRANAYHVHGAYCRELLLATEWNTKPVVSTAHGVILVPRPGDRTQPEPGRIMLFGRMEAYKGIDVLAEAARILRTKGVSFRLVLAGRGPELERFQGAANAHEDVEIIARFLAPQEAIRQFQRASIIVAPYRDATQSGVVAAAFGNGRPVVASRVGGLVDTITHGVNGLLIPPNDPVALAAALEQILTSDDLQRRLLDGARAAAATALDWSRISATLLHAYAELRAS